MLTSFYRHCVAGLVAFCAAFTVSSLPAEVIGFESFYSAASPDAFEYRFGPSSPLDGSLTVSTTANGFLSYAISSKSAFAGPAPIANTADFGDPANYWLNGDDSVSSTGTGASGSNVWLSVYNGNYTPPGREVVAGSTIFSLPEHLRFQQVSISNNLINVFAYQNGLSDFTFPLIPGDYFGVRFLSLDGLNNVIGQSNWIDLAVYSPVNGLSMVTDWIDVDLSSLNSNRIGFEFTGTDVSGPFINTPTYLSLDNFVVTAVPEPASWLLIGLTTSAFAWRKRRSHSRCNAQQLCE